MNGANSAASTIVLITRREFVTRVRTKMFAISTIILLVAVAGFALVMHFVGDRASSVDVGLVPAAASVSAPLQATGEAVGLTVRTSQVPDEAAGQQALRDGDLDAVVIRAGGTVAVQVRKSLDNQLRATFTVLARQLAQDAAVSASGGDADQVNAALASAGLQVQSLEQTPQYQSERIVLGLLAGILVYLSLMIYGQTVAQGVVEEKTSRVVELLLAAVRPWQLMLGKVVGIGAAGLLQMVLVTGVGAGVALALGSLSMPSSIAVGTVVWTLVWYLLGFVMYALLFAAAGALVSRQEDVGGVTAPILTLIIVPYIIGVSVLPTQPDNGLARVLSLIPVFSPTLMPVRTALGEAAGWEMVLTVILSIGLTAVLVGLAGRVYGNSVMRTGARVRLSDALRPL